MSEPIDLDQFIKDLKDVEPKSQAEKLVLILATLLQNELCKTRDIIDDLAYDVRALNSEVNSLWSKIP